MKINTPSPHTITAVLTGILVAILPKPAGATEPTPLFDHAYTKGVHSDMFPLPAGAEDVLLTISCGDQRSQTRVSSAVVWLNGKVLFRPRDFNQNVDRLVRSLAPDNLESENNLIEVDIEGRPSASLQILVTARLPEPESVPQSAPPANQPVAWYHDSDFDGFGFGPPGLFLPASVDPYQPPSFYQWVTRGGDCNDLNADIYPGHGC